MRSIPDRGNDVRTNWAMMMMLMAMVPLAMHCATDCSRTSHGCDSQALQQHSKYTCCVFRSNSGRSSASSLSASSAAAAIASWGRTNMVLIPVIPPDDAVLVTSVSLL